MMELIVIVIVNVTVIEIVIMANIFTTKSSWAPETRLNHEFEFFWFRTT